MTFLQPALRDVNTVSSITQMCNTETAKSVTSLTRNSHVCHVFDQSGISRARGISCHVADNSFLLVKYGLRSFAVSGLCCMYISVITYLLNYINYVNEKYQRQAHRATAEKTRHGEYHWRSVVDIHWTPDLASTVSHPVTQTTTAIITIFIIITNSALYPAQDCTSSSAVAERPRCRVG